MFDNNYFMKNFTIRVRHTDENTYEIYINSLTYIGEEKLLGVCIRGSIDTMVYNDFGVALIGNVNGGLFIFSVFDAINKKYVYDQEYMKNFYNEYLTFSKSKQSQILERKFR